MTDSNAKPGKPRGASAKTDAQAAAAPTYEQARAELATVVERLEAGGSTLEEALALWERGEELADICQHWLDGARSRLSEARERRAATDESG